MPAKALCLLTSRFVTCVVAEGVVRLGVEMMCVYAHLAGTNCTGGVASCSKRDMGDETPLPVVELAESISRTESSGVDSPLAKVW